MHISGEHCSLCECVNVAGSDPTDLFQTPRRNAYSKSKYFLLVFFQVMRRVHLSGLWARTQLRRSCETYIY